MKLLCYIALSIAIISCSTPPEVNNIKPNEATTLTKPIVKIDTIEIQRKIIKSLEDKSPIDTLEEFPLLIDTIIKVKLTNDSIRDYFVITTFGHWPLYQGLFFDGKTGNKIPVDSNFIDAPISRFKMPFKVLSPNCNSNNNSILTSISVSGFIGEQNYIFGYNPNSKQMEVTLKLFTTNEEFDTEYIDSIFYLSIFNKTLTCLDTIKLYRGKGLNQRNSLSFNNIEKLNNKPISYYIFDEKLFRWNKNVW